MTKTKPYMDWRVDYTTVNGNGAYIVVSARTRTEAKKRARQQIILHPAEKIASMEVSGGWPR